MNIETVGLDVFHSGGNEIVSVAKALKRKKLLGFLADQDGYIHGLPIFVPKIPRQLLVPTCLQENQISSSSNCIRKPEGWSLFVRILPVYII